MKVWMVATYKINELKRLQDNLKNQAFEYYNPKIKVRNLNLSPKEEPLFPGYIFINANPEYYQKIKYTKGITEVIRFNKSIAILHNNEINELKKIEDHSFAEPFIQKIFVGQEATMSKGPFKGSLITIASLPKNDRVNIFLHILGTKRKIMTPLKEINI